jgi:hypothetical protein
MSMDMVMDQVVFRSRCNVLPARWVLVDAVLEPSNSRLVDETLFLAVSTT